MPNFGVKEIGPDGQSLQGEWTNVDSLSAIDVGSYEAIDGTTINEAPPGFWLQVKLHTDTATTITINTQGDPNFEAGVVSSAPTLDLTGLWDVALIWLDPFRRKFLENNSQQILISDPLSSSEAVAFFMR